MTPAPATSIITTILSMATTVANSMEMDTIPIPAIHTIILRQPQAEQL